MLRAKLGNCVDTCLANMQGDARLQGISTTLDLMRLQMLVLGLASGAASMYGMRAVLWPGGWWCYTQLYSITLTE